MKSAITRGIVAHVLPHWSRDTAEEREWQKETSKPRASGRGVTHQPPVLPISSALPLKELGGTVAKTREVDAGKVVREVSDLS